jgi:cysteine protease ATG4
MLIAFLVKSEEDWHGLRKSLAAVTGKMAVRIADKEPALHGPGSPRADALDEVESFDDNDDFEAD